MHADHETPRDHDPPAGTAPAAHDEHAGMAQAAPVARDNGHDKHSAARTISTPVTPSRWRLRLRPAAVGVSQPAVQPA